MTTRTTPGIDVDEPRTALEAVARALRRETHVPTGRPELTWQRLAGHTGSVFACAVSPDGTWIAGGPGGEPWQS